MTFPKSWVGAALCAAVLSCGSLKMASAQDVLAEKTRETVQQKSFRLDNIDAHRVAGWLQTAQNQTKWSAEQKAMFAASGWKTEPRLPGNGNGPADLEWPAGLQAIGVNERGELIAFGDAAGLEALGKLLPSLDVPLVQFQVEARFYEFDRAELPKLGLDFWNGTAQIINGAAVIAPVGCEANLQKLADQKRAVLLTSPELTVIDGERGELKSVTSQSVMLENVPAPQTPPVINVPPLGSALIQSETGFAATLTRRGNNGITIESEANVQARHLKSSAQIRENQTLALRLTPANEKRQILVLVTAQKIRRAGE